MRAHNEHACAVNTKAICDSTHKKEKKTISRIPSEEDQVIMSSNHCELFKLFL